MTQISSAALTLLMLLTVSLFCHQTAAWACCRRYSKGQLPLSVIRGYSVQSMNANCNINAVIFLTHGGRKVCVDPSQSWVTDSIQKLMTRVRAMKRKGKQQ